MRRYGRCLGLVLVLAVVVSLCSCQLMGEGEVKENDTFTPPPTGRYLDFSDVRIPAGMYLDRDGSFVYESDTVKAGMLNIYGRNDMSDTLRFFEQNMAKDGWTMLSTFKYQKSILLFTKPGKVCTIVAYPASSLKNLNMEVWVAPVRDGAQAARVVVPESHSAGLFGRAGKIPIGVTDLMSKEEPLPNNREPLPSETGFVARARQATLNASDLYAGQEEHLSDQQGNAFEPLPVPGGRNANSYEPIPKQD